LSNFAIVNLMELDDAVGGRIDGLEGRMGRSRLESRDLGISHWRYAPNVRSGKGHSHREQEEAYVVIGGSGEVLIEGDVHALRQWDVVRVAPEAVRAFAAGPDGLDLIAVGGPKPEEGDGVLADLEWPGAQ
jgi:quercetin dioxygenase-like cupin family protein